MDTDVACDDVEVPVAVPVILLCVCLISSDDLRFLFVHSIERFDLIATFLVVKTNHLTLRLVFSLPDAIIALK